MREIIGTPPPNAGPRVLLPARWPTLEAPMSFTVLSPAPVGIALHYVDVLGNGQGRSRPCLLPDPCGYHGNSLRDGWAGYVGALSHWAHETVMVPFTEDAWRDICERLIGDEPIRATRWTATRGRNRANGPWVITRERQTLHHKEIPEPPDLYPSLRGIYGDIAQLRRKPVILSDENGGTS